MRDADERVGPLPCGESGEVDHAVLGRKVVYLTSGRRDDIAAEAGDYAAVHIACAVGEGARHADDGLSAAAHGSAGDEIKLTSGAAYLPRAGAFRAHLTVKIGRDAGVY